MPAYLIIGASRGIGLELTSQLLARNDPSTFVYATARNPGSASLLAAVMERYSGRCAVLECDLAEEASCKVSERPGVCARWRTEGRRGGARIV